MIAHIVCGSPHLWLPDCSKWSNDYVIGVDLGALKLIERGIDFDIAIGDFDSVSEVERQLIKERVEQLLVLPGDKDVTDCEAAIVHAIEKGYKQLYLYGATGGRFDHQFATIMLLLKYVKQGIEIKVVDEKNIICIWDSKPRGFLAKMETKKYVSFFAVEGMVKNLKISGVKYPLGGYDLKVDDSLCVSNEILHGEMSVSFDSGYLLIVQSSD